MMNAFRPAKGEGVFFGSGDCPTEVPDVSDLRDSNGAARSHRPQTAVAFLFAWIVSHKVMARDGDCTSRLATRMPSFRRFCPGTPASPEGTVAATAENHRRYRNQPLV
jgi:hypothetical protein